MSSDSVRCYDDTSMSSGFNYFFNSSLYPVESQATRRRFLFGKGRILEDAIQPKGTEKFPTLKSCQDSSSIMMDSSENSTKHAGLESSYMHIA